jgi:hypothetical protein
MENPFDVTITENAFMLVSTELRGFGVIQHGNY